MFHSTHARLLPLSADVGVIEAVAVFVTATIALQTFLFATAAAVEFSRRRSERNLGQILSELRGSLSNPPAAILTTMAWDLVVRPHTPSAQRYSAHDMSLASMPRIDRLLLEWLAVFVATDFYIYFEHRLMHTRFWYTRIHKHHHQFHTPTAFAGFAQHPLEAVLFTVGSLWIQAIPPRHVVVSG